jgi:hypothetical protein
MDGFLKVVALYHVRIHLIYRNLWGIRRLMITKPVIWIMHHRSQAKLLKWLIIYRDSYQRSTERTTISCSIFCWNHINIIDDMIQFQQISFKLNFNGNWLLLATSTERIFWLNDIFYQHETTIISKMLCFFINDWYASKINC